MEQECSLVDACGLEGGGKFSGSWRKPVTWVFPPEIKRLRFGGRVRQVGRDYEFSPKQNASVDGQALGQEEPFLKVGQRNTIRETEQRCVCRCN
jgi:hypothetical protein